MSTAIEGKHHIVYKVGAGNWTIEQKSDEDQIDYSDDRGELVSRMRLLDAHADHFIQQGREAALAEVRGCIEQLESEVPDLATMKQQDAYIDLNKVDSLLDFAQAVHGNFAALLSDGEVTGD